MQLTFENDPQTERLRETHAHLIEWFGRIQRPHTKRVDPVWTLVQGVIGARTKTAVSNAATDQLLERFGSWEAVAEAELSEVTEILSNQTFPEQSARRLIDCLQTIITERGEVDLRHLSNQSTADAMMWLETMPGVARKIAAQVMNTSAFARRAMVIDSHHRRIMQRMGLVPTKADTARAYNALMPIMPDDWSAADMDEHHMLVKKLGQKICRPTNPQCARCPVAELCDFASVRR
ncbi:endonuclease III [Altererythrobacter sp. ZODW24]|uniref:endonuclease III domain-containing protein n=1 Tax=Altererythrobacter sp. ZODW24 TaxID=2185142 RepID=UPI000DF76D10|nr:endonuclease III [Altererythrobacter sp. ZODW24]